MQYLINLIDNTNNLIIPKIVKDLEQKINDQKTILKHIIDKKLSKF